MLAASNGQVFPPARDQTPRQLRKSLSDYVATLWAGIAQEPVHTVEDRVLQHETQKIPVRIYTPPTPRATIVYFHGGGYVAGDLDTHDPMSRRLANGASARVVSVGYRLAPEHPYPAGVDDCLAATTWSAQQYPQLPLLVGGDSAGGTMAIAVTLRARDDHGPDIDGQALIYPAIDASGSTHSRQQFSTGYGLTQADMQYYADAYFPDPQIRINDPYADLFRRNDLHHLPPALITTAGFDPLLDEGAEYAARLIRAGVPVTYQPEPNLVHGYIDLAGIVPVAHAARHRIIGWADQLITGLASFDQ